MNKSIDNYTLTTDVFEKQIIFLYAVLSKRCQENPPGKTPSQRAKIRVRIWGVGVGNVGKWGFRRVFLESSKHYLRLYQLKN